MIDLLIVAFYLIALLVIGIYKRSKNIEFKSFATVKNRGLEHTGLLLIATIFVSSIGGGTTFGIAEKAFSGNLAYSYALLLAIPIDLLIAKYIIPRLVKHQGAESVGDIMFVYYGSIGRIIGGAAALFVSIGLVAAQISVSGRIFEYILQINYIEGVVVSYGIVLIYTTIGGFRSVLFTNQLQFFAIIISIPIISIFGIYQIGLGEFINQVPSEKFDIINNPELLKTTIMAFLGFATMNLFPTFIQRALINKDANRTKNAIYLKSVIYGIFLIFITINGLVAFVIYPEITSPLALPYLIDHIIPVGIQGIVVTGLLAAVMSTADSDLNITSVTLVKDFLQPIFNLSNQRFMLNIARLVNVIIGIFAIAIALYFSSVVDLVIFISGFWGPIILVPLIFGLYDVVISKFGMTISSLAGIVSFVSWEHSINDPLSLKGVFVGTSVNFVSFLSFYIIDRVGNDKISKRI